MWLGKRELKHSRTKRCAMYPGSRLAIPNVCLTRFACDQEFESSKRITEETLARLSERERGAFGAAGEADLRSALK
jgi:hypothetical protein